MEEEKKCGSCEHYIIDEHFVGCLYKEKINGETFVCCYECKQMVTKDNSNRITKPYKDAEGEVYELFFVCKKCQNSK